MKDYSTFGEPLTSEVARSIYNRCGLVCGIGPRSDALRKVATESQMRELRALWERLPATYSLWGTLTDLMNGFLPESAMPPDIRSSGGGGS